MNEMQTLPGHIEHWDDEREIGNSLIVTLKPGWSYLPNEHEGVRGFDTVAEAKYASAKKRIYGCYCRECQSTTSSAQK